MSSSMPRSSRAAIGSTSSAGRTSGVRSTGAAAVTRSTACRSRMQTAGLSSSTRATSRPARPPRATRPAATSTCTRRSRAGRAGASPPSGRDASRTRRRRRTAIAHCRKRASRTSARPSSPLRSSSTRVMTCSRGRSRVFASASATACAHVRSISRATRFRTTASMTRMPRSGSTTCDTSLSGRPTCCRSCHTVPATRSSGSSFGRTSTAISTSRPSVTSFLRKPRSSSPSCTALFDDAIGEGRPHDAAHDVAAREALQLTDCTWNRQGVRRADTARLARGPARPARHVLRQSGAHARPAVSP